ncbi:hypothetical protein IJH29_01705 [Candidatus Saccharibacteria bacterium]|nr:hypothetical protein [Candidatus Saccharibacteria bacterium]
MAVIVTKDEDDNVALSEKINADLREKMSRTQNNQNDTPDFGEPSEYLENYTKTNRFTWVWFVLIILALIALVFFILL